MHCKPDYKCCDKFDGSYDEVKQNHGIHYAKAVCKYCHHFIKWLPDPKITKMVENRDKEIRKYIEMETVEDKYKTVLTTLIGIRFLTPKQNNFYEYIKSKASIAN